MRRRRAVGKIHYGGLGKEEPHSEVFSLAKCRLRVPGSLEFGEVYLKKYFLLSIKRPILGSDGVYERAGS